MLKTNIDILEMIKLPLSEYILKIIGDLEQEGQQPTTLFAVCPNSKIRETAKNKFNV